MRYAETGYNLEIDLSRGNIERVATDPRDMELHLGGQGTAAKLRLYMMDGLAVAIMANGSGFDRNELADAAANVVFSTMGQ